MPIEGILPPAEVPDALALSQQLEELVRVHRRRLVQAAVNEGLQADEALDVLQEALLRFSGHAEWPVQLRDDVEGAGRLLTTLVKNEARNLRRKKYREALPMTALTEADEAGQALEEVLSQAEAHVRLSGCIATLKERQRAVVVARFFEGKSGEEVAAELGLTPGNVAVILHRARSSLATCIRNSRELLEREGVLPHS